MTTGEKAVWAAVFAKRLDLSPPPGMAAPLRAAELREWERDQVVSAIESACYAVIYLRDARDEIHEDYGPDVVAMYNEVVNET
jgi:hypothetical protein